MKELIEFLQKVDNEWKKREEYKNRLKEYFQEVIIPEIKENKIFLTGIIIFFIGSLLTLTILFPPKTSADRITEINSSKLKELFSMSSYDVYNQEFYHSYEDELISLLDKTKINKNTNSILAFSYIYTLMYLGKNEFQKALEQINETKKYITRQYINANPSTLHKLNIIEGISLFHLNQLDSAEKKIINYLPKLNQIPLSLDKFLIYNYLGKIYFERADYKNAIIFWNGALQFESKRIENYRRAEIYKNLAMVHYETREFDFALSNLKDFIALTEINEIKLIGEYEKARILKRIGKDLAAKDLVDEIISSCKKNRERFFRWETSNENSYMELKIESNRGNILEWEADWQFQKLKNLRDRIILNEYLLLKSYLTRNQMVEAEKHSELLKIYLEKEINFESKSIIQKGIQLFDSLKNGNDNCIEKHNSIYSISQRIEYSLKNKKDNVLGWASHVRANFKLPEKEEKTFIFERFIWIILLITCIGTFRRGVIEDREEKEEMEKEISNLKTTINELNEVNRQKTELIESQKDKISELTKPEKCIVTFGKRNPFTIDADYIVFIATEKANPNNITIYYLNNGKLEFETKRETISAAINKLPEDYFFRANQSSIVNLKKVTTFDKKEIKMILQTSSIITPNTNHKDFSKKYHTLYHSNPE